MGYMEPMSYANLGSGAAAEMFDRELEKVLANIQDPNHPYKPKREITLSVAFYPDESREKARIEISVASKAPGFRACETQAYIGLDPRDKTKPRAYDSNPNQNRMPFMSDEGQSTSNTIPFERNSTHG